MENRLQDLIHLAQELSQVHDLDAILEKILSLSREFMRADAGSIYVVEEEHVLRFEQAQNDSLTGLAGKRDGYNKFTIQINHDSIAGYVADTGETLNIPDVYSIPEDRPYSFDRSYDERTGYRTRSCLTVPLMNANGRILGVLQLINTTDDDGNIAAVCEEALPMVHLFAKDASHALENAAMTRALLMRMVKMAEIHDPKETGAHVIRVGNYSCEIYEKWALTKGLAPHEIERNKDTLRMAAMLHDIGKVGISDAILKKPGKLDHDEYEAMKEHTVLGAQMFTPPESDLDEAALDISLNHHERWDGAGYPGFVDEDGTRRGRKGGEIPLFARIVSVADVYDALCSKRSYKESWPEEQVLEELRSATGTQFDPEVIDAFFAADEGIQAVREASRE